MNNNFKTTCKDLTETAHLTKMFNKHIQNGIFVCWFGEIGAGKTAFVKLLAKDIGITDKVTSPSFVILNEYKTGNKVPFYHFDLYRLENTGVSSISDELREYSRDGIFTFVEWAEFSDEQLPFDRIDINVTYNDDDSRNYEFTARGDKYLSVIEGLNNDFT